MELALLKSLLNKKFYDEYRGDRCPHRLFSKEMGKIKTLIDHAMDKYKRDLTVSEIEGLFLANEKGLTTSEIDEYKAHFNKMKYEDPVGSDVANEILSKLFQKDVGSQLYALSFDYVNNKDVNLEPLRKILNNHREDFLPDLNIE